MSEHQRAIRVLQARSFSLTPWRLLRSMLASAGLRTSIGSRRMSVFWSEMDVADLAHSLATGQSVSEVARFLCRDEPEVRDKMKELGLVERPS